MKHLFALAMLLGLVLSGRGQTRRIYHKSHSGSYSTYSSALQQNLFGTRASNYGNPKMDADRLDSVIKLNNTTVVLVVSTVHIFGFNPDSNNSWGSIPAQSKQREKFVHNIALKGNLVPALKDKLSKMNFVNRDKLDSVPFTGFDTQELPTAPAKKTTKK